MHRAALTLFGWIWLAVAITVFGVSADAHPLGVGGGYNVQPPPECAALGMTVLTYSVNANYNKGTVDTGRAYGTYASGKRVYAWNWLSGSVNGNDILTTNPDGSISVFGVSGPNGQASSGGLITTSPYFVGKAFVGGGCFQAVMSFDPSQIDYIDNLAPAFWMMDKRHLDNQCADQWPGQYTSPTCFQYWSEVDWIEARGTPPQFWSSFGEWWGQSGITCAPNIYCSVFQHNVSSLPGSKDWTKWHTVTGVVVDSTTSEAGYTSTYFDHVQVGSSFTWSHCSASTPPAGPPPVSPYFGCSVDSAEYVLIWGSNAPSGLPGAGNFRSINVWQTPAAAALDVVN